MNYLPLCSLLFLMFVSCTDSPREENTEATAKQEVLEEFNAMYKTYAKGTDEFYNFFEEDFVRVDMQGKTHRGVKDQKSELNDYLSKNNKFELLSYGEPTLVSSNDQVVTINPYEELFINESGSDTTFNKGVYIAVWKKQADDTWKISMDTWHSGLE
jgi:ketosteroid isomerase-like protein